MSLQRWNTTNALVSWERDDEGEWVRYEDYVELLKALQERRERPDRSGA